MLPFLQSVANGYASRFTNPQLPASQDYCFVFPNKRAGTFFLKHLRDALPEGTDIIAPEVTTISDFTAGLSGRLIDTRIDLIFLLYRCYCSIMNQTEGGKGSKETVSFDSFRRWGETVLRDFNEVDMQDVDPDAIFKNVADFRKISSTFLTEEHRRLIEEYFGYRVEDYDDSSFWQDFGEDYDDAPEGIRSKFIHLWKVLAPLYHIFHDELARRGLATSGGAYRIALSRLDEAIGSDDPQALPRLLPYAKIVFVGFNALSIAERRLFRTLRGLKSPSDVSEPLADCVWDATGPILRDRNNSAGRFVAVNRRDFKEPEWLTPYLKESDTDSLPGSLEAIASPSKVMQVKIATSQIVDLMKTLDKEAIADARVALVVPDESLLLPLLYSLPKEITEVNLTMGYPLKLTAVTSFLSLLRGLQLMPRNSSGYQGYAYEQLRDLLSHPYSHAVFSTQRIRRFCRDKERRHVNVVRATELSELGPTAERILMQIDPGASPFDVIGYLDDVLSIVGDAITGTASCAGDTDGLIKGELELKHVRAWRDALLRFAESIREYDISMSPSTTLAEAYRLLRGEIVAFEGEPLRGLQIMGMLETRALDFDQLIIVGLNDRTIPGRQRQRSFIPNVVRRGFGMPPNTYQEDLFGYYFFRLLSRASGAKMIFDNRISGLTGGESRYLLQLRHIYARELVRDIEYKFRLSAKSFQKITVIKTPEVLEALERYCREPLEDERRFNLSASLIKKYTACPLKLYFHGVLDLKDDPEPSLTVDPITYGNIIHKVIENLYLPDSSSRERWLDPPLPVTKDMLRDIIEDKEGKIPQLIRREINRRHYHKNDDMLDSPLEADTEIIAEAMKEHLLDVLHHDFTLAPFNLYGCEVTDTYDYYLPDGRRVNMKYAIDRIDDAECDGEVATLRIVDYKTGGSHISAGSLADLFSDNYAKDNLLQLIIYSLLINLRREESGLRTLDFKPRIYPVGRIGHLKKNGRLKQEMTPRIGADFIDVVNPVIPDFIPGFDAMLAEIFDPSTPFEGEPDERKCRYCIFFDACRSAGSTTADSPDSTDSDNPPTDYMRSGESRSRQ